jgi:hypothetical protein
MRTAIIAAALAFAACMLPAAAGAQRAFSGPAGWDHTASGAPGAAAPSSIETWKKGEQSVSVLTDTSVAYADVLARVRKNIGDNGIHPAVDRDLTCGGKPAHEVEMTLGTTTFHQLLIDEGTGQGSTRVTYSRPQSAPAATEVAAALSAYCAP